MKKLHKIEYKINNDTIIELMKGNELHLIDYSFGVDVCIYPPNHGIYLTYEEYRELKAIHFSSYPAHDSLFNRIEERRELLK